MKIAIIIGYLVCAVLVGLWNEALDTRLGVEPEASRAWLTTTIVALTWPLSVPVAMIALASGGGGRWTALKHTAAR